MSPRSMEPGGEPPAPTPTYKVPSCSLWVGGQERGALSGEVPVISEIGGSLAIWGQAGPTHYIFSLLGGRDTLGLWSPCSWVDPGFTTF